ADHLQAPGCLDEAGRDLRPAADDPAVGLTRVRFEVFFGTLELDLGRHAVLLEQLDANRVDRVGDQNGIPHSTARSASGSGTRSYRAASNGRRLERRRAM